MSLFRLKINGQFVVMENPKVNMNWKSPVFKEEGEGRTRTYSFKIPAAPNEIIFNLSGFLETRDTVFEYDGEVYFGSKYHKKCKVVVTGFNGDYYEIRAILSVNNFDLNKEKQLNEFAYERPTRGRYFLPASIYADFQFGLTTGGATTGSTVLSIDIEQVFFKYFKKTYLITYNAGETLSTLLENVENAINEDYKLHGLIASIQSANTIRFTDTWSNGLRNDPFFYSDDVNYFDFLDSVVNTSFYSPNFGLQAVAHANAVVADPNNYDYVFAPIYMPYLDNTVAVANLWQPDVYDLYGPGFRSMQGSAIPDENKRNALFPMPYLYSVIELIHEELKIKLDDQFFNDELKKLVLIPNTIFSDNYNITFHNINFHYADIVPDVTLAEFIKQIESLFNIVFDYESVDGYCKIIAKVEILRSQNVQDLTETYTNSYSFRERFYTQEKGLGYALGDDNEILNNNVGINGVVNGEFTAFPLKAQINSYQIKKSDNLIYRYTGVWLSSASGLSNYYKKVNQEIKTIDVATFDRQTRSDNYINTRKINWLIPRTVSKVFSIGTKGEKNAIRLLFYRGMQPCTYELVTTGAIANGNYPMLDYHNYNLENVQIGNYSLSFYGENGIYDTFHKSWNMFFFNSRQIELILVLSEVEVARLNILEPILIKNQLFIISEVDLQFSDENILAKVRAFKVISK